jgi:alkylation response protein AidB-like acyl-CoA dehydrogenase
VTDAVCRTLERHDLTLAARWIPHLTGSVEPTTTAAVLLTEAQSGADLGLVETVAVPDETGVWRVTGQKWFAATAGADLALVLARPEETASGTRGLALFVVPRRLEDGSLNAMRVEALRQSAGLAGLAVGRVRFAGAEAWPVGRPGRGFRQALDAITVTRVLLGAVAAAITRQAAESARNRALGTAGVRDVGTEPLYQEERAELVVDAVAATTGALVGADVLHRTDHGRLGNDGSLRLLAPLLKRTLSDLATTACVRAIRLAGGAEARTERSLLDDAIALAAWEGSPNVLALEVVRAADQGHVTVLFTDLERRLTGTGPAALLAARLLEELGRQRAELEELALLEEPVQQLRAAQLADRLALLTLSSFLVEQGAAHAEQTGSGRLLWVAARFAARLAGPARVPPARDAHWLRYAPALLDDDGTVPLAVGRDAVAEVAGADWP